MPFQQGPVKPGHLSNVQQLKQSAQQHCQCQCYVVPKTQVELNKSKRHSPFLPAFDGRAPGDRPVPGQVLHLALKEPLIGLEPLGARAQAKTYWACFCEITQLYIFLY